MGSSVSTEQLSQRHVVIIGGGFAGCELGVLLQKWHVPFTIIDPKEYFHIIVANVRAVVEKSFIKKTMIPYKETFGTKFVQAMVTGVDLEKKEVSLDNGNTITYTDLVFSVGNGGPFPGRLDSGSIEEAVKLKEDMADEIEKSESVVVIGGGAVGIEIAGEIATKYPNKKISIIHSNKILASPRFGDAFQNNLKKCLEGKNIQTILEERVENIGDLTFGKFMKQTIKTNKGNSFEADLVIKCTGLGPRTDLTEKIFDSSKFDSRKLKVTPELLVEGYDNVYAMGDCCNTQEEKMAAHCAYHAQTVATNIYNSIKGQPKVAYKQGFNGMIVTIGSCSGAGVVNGFNVPSIACSLIKGKSLFIPKFWSMMGQKEPS